MHILQMFCTYLHVYLTFFSSYSFRALIITIRVIRLPNLLKCIFLKIHTVVLRDWNPRSVCFLFTSFRVIDNLEGCTKYKDNLIRLRWTTVIYVHLFIYFTFHQGGGKGGREFKEIYIHKYTLGIVLCAYCAQLYAMRIRYRARVKVVLYRDECGWTPIPSSVNNDRSMVFLPRHRN